MSPIVSFQSLRVIGLRRFGVNMFQGVRDNLFCVRDNLFCSAYFYAATLADTSNVHQRTARASGRIKHPVPGFTCIFLVKRLFTDLNVFQWLANEEQ